MKYARNKLVENAIVYYVHQLVQHSSLHDELQGSRQYRPSFRFQFVQLL